MVSSSTASAAGWRASSAAAMQIAQFRLAFGAEAPFAGPLSRRPPRAMLPARRDASGTNCLQLSGPATLTTAPPTEPSPRCGRGHGPRPLTTDSGGARRANWGCYNVP